jgi:putative polyketide hydroxylase
VAGDPQPWERAAEGVPVHRLDADFLPAGTALLLRPDDVVAWRGTDVAAPERVRHELLHPTPVAARV